jgi:serine protease
MTRSIVIGGLAASTLLACSGAAGPADESTSRASEALVPFAASHTPLDFPKKAHAPRRDANTTQTLAYYGGPVISNPKIYVVWWGSPTNLKPAITAAHGGIADFFAGVTNSSFLDWMNEYDTDITVQAGSHKGEAGTGQLIGRGNYAGTITLTAVPAGNVTDEQIQATLDEAFTKGALPEPDANTIYALYFPSSVSISLDGDASCFTWGAYHFNTTETKRHDAYYMVVPDCGDDFAGTTVTTSHELIEATTDALPTAGSVPAYPQAWNDTSADEAGDLCEGSSGTVATALGSFTVQGIWDEASQGCKSFRSYAQDFNVSFATPALVGRASKTTTVTIDTATVAGKAQTLSLSVVAPLGVKATLAAKTVLSGSPVKMTVTAPRAVEHVQVVVRAAGTTGTAAQTHTAALLFSAH